MNIRLPITALALCLASGMAFADTQSAKPAAESTAATTTAARPAAKPIAHHSAKCKADQTKVNGKCETKKAG